MPADREQPYPALRRSNGCGQLVIARPQPLHPVGFQAVAPDVFPGSLSAAHELAIVLDNQAQHDSGDQFGIDLSRQPMSVRIAAHMAYALHNEAEVAYSNADSQLGHATQKITAIDQVLDVTDGAALLSRFNVRD